MSAAATVVLGLVVPASVLAEHLLPYAAEAIDLERRSVGPTLAGGHLFGTDQLGRDYLTRVVVGIRASAVVALTVALLSSLIGTSVGLVAGYYAGLTDRLLMRVTDGVLTVPALALLLAVAGLTARRSTVGVGLVIGALSWPVLAKMVRANVASLRQAEFVEGARAVGASDARTLSRHVLPAILGIVVVHAAVTVPAAILLEASLSFLGYGVQPPTPSLGRLIAEGQSSMLTDWWLVVFPGLAIVVLCLAVSVVGDGLRRALDPARSS